MNVPAHITEAIRAGKMTYCGEGQLSNYGDTALKGQYVEFFLDDGPDGSDRHPFKGLKRGREKGQRFGLIAVPLGDDDAVEAPVAQEKPRRKPARTRGEFSRRMCGVATFQEFLGVSSYDAASLKVKLHCGVQSKTALDTNKVAAAAWDSMLTAYEQKYGRMATMTGA